MKLKTATVLILSALLTSAGVIPLEAEAASARPKQKTQTIRQPTITTAALRAAAPLYQQNVAKLTNTRGSARTPKPNVAATPSGNQTIATPSNQPKMARTWSTTATTGRRESVGNVSNSSVFTAPSARQAQSQ